MHHPSRKSNIGVWLLVPVLVLLGCDDGGPRQSEDLPPHPGEARVQFDPASAGAIRGRVVWDGAIPSVAPFEVLPNPLAGELLQKQQLRPNPNAPRIEPHTKGVTNAIVFLRGIDPRRGRRWNHSPVTVYQREGQFSIEQDKTVSPFGFVRRGDAITMVSQDRVFHSLHAGGAAFFTLTFPDPDLPLTRPLNEPGIVELTSAAGYFWMRAYLFVSDHPYTTRTDAEGTFVLRDVPPGSYELVCWMPSWVKARHERDPESGFVARLFFQPPVERTQALTLEPRETKQTTFVLSAALFLQGQAQ